MSHLVTVHDDSSASRKLRAANLKNQVPLEELDFSASGNVGTRVCLGGRLCGLLGLQTSDGKGRSSLAASSIILGTR